MGRIISEAILSRNTQKLSKRKRQMPYGCTKKRDYNIGSNIPIPPTCPESTSYTISNVSYYTTVASDAVNNTISFSYVETIVKTDCTSKYRRGNDSIDVLFDANDTHNSKIIKGTVQYYNIEISYSFIQEGIPCEEKTNYIVSNVDYSRAIDAETTANTLTIDYIKTTINKDCQTTTINGSEKIIVECGENISYDQRTISGRITWNNNDIEYSFIQKGVTCDASTSYTISNVSYPQSVEYNATNAVISFSYIKTIINSDCSVVNNPGTDSIEIEFDTNTTHNPKTITGEVRYQGVEIRYSFTQKGAPCEERVSYSITNVTYNDYVNCDATANTIHFNYVETHTNTNCETSVNSVAKNVDVVFDENTTSEEKTISGTITYNGLPISYSFIQGAYSANNRIIANYKITRTDMATKLFNSNNVKNTIEIDGVTQSCNNGYYKFSTIGNHTIKLTLIDSTIINDSFFSASHEVTDIVIPNGVTTIGDASFWGCSGLTSITIPNSVISIGERAFTYCDGLTNVAIPDSVTSIGRYAFADCSSLTSINIPNNITSIEELTFYNCKSLTSITIPSSVTNIGHSAFAGCANLTDAIIGGGTIGDWAFFECAKLSSCTIDNNVTAIGEAVFGGCISLTSMTIPDSVTSIGGSAFADCSGLTNINISNYITSIERYTFSGCKSLTSITIPDSVTSVDNLAFCGCSSLISIIVGSGNTVYDSRNNCNAIIETKSNTLIVGCKNSVFLDTINHIGENSFYQRYAPENVIIPNSVTSIGKYAFASCSGLTSIIISNNITSIEEDTFSVCKSLTCVTIPNSVTTIGNAAFYLCSNLTSISIPDSVTSIGSMAFDGCRGLTTCTIGSGVINIGSQAFNNCQNITSVTIPGNVVTIGNIAFAHCNSLTNITIEAIVPPTLGGSRVFDHTNDCPIYVPSTSVNNYKTATNWSYWANRIQAIDVYNGHEYVDLGLPSGTLWAKTNIGADSETDFGKYFQWGDVTGYYSSQVGTDKVFNWANYRYSDNGTDTMTKYNNTDGLTTLELSDDAARVNMGGLWRMPTADDFDELITATTVNREIVTINNVKGCKISSKTDSSKYIFFPAAGGCKYDQIGDVGSDGYYWSSSLYTVRVDIGLYLWFRNGDCYVDNYVYRFEASPIRGIIKP